MKRHFEKQYRPDVSVSTETEIPQEFIDIIERVREVALNSDEEALRERWQGTEAQEMLIDRLQEGMEVFFSSEGDETTGYVALMPAAGFLRMKGVPVPELIEKLLRLDRVYSTYGILLKPEYRQKGISENLWRTVVEKLHPEAIIGQTKSPAAVLSRARVMQEAGFRTFLGTDEIVPAADAKTTPFKLHVIQKLNPAMRGSEAEHGLIIERQSINDAAVPDVSGYPESVRAAFADLIAEQERQGDAATVMKSLVSLKEHI